MKQTEPHCRQILTEKLVQLCDIVEKNQGGLTMHMLKKEFMDRVNRFHFFFIFLPTSSLTVSPIGHAHVTHACSIMVPAYYVLWTSISETNPGIWLLKCWDSWLIHEYIHGYWGKWFQRNLNYCHFLSWSSLIDFCSHSDKDYGKPCNWFYIALLEMQVGLRVKGPGLRLPDHNGPHDGPGLFQWPKRKYI